MPSTRSNLSPARAADREISIIAVLTVAGLVLRLWRPGRMGLVHFDEGIYAIAGLWSVSPRSLAGLDPMVIPYAPAGYPVLVGLAYLGLGVSDIAAILVSIVAGTHHDSRGRVAGPANIRGRGRRGRARHSWRFRGLTSRSREWL